MFTYFLYNVCLLRLSSMDFLHMDTHLRCIFCVYCACYSYRTAMIRCGQAIVSLIVLLV